MEKYIAVAAACRLMYRPDSGRFAMIYVVDAKFFESTAGDADRCLKSPPGVVRAGARVKSPEPVMRRLPRRKVK